MKTKTLIHRFVVILPLEKSLESRLARNRDLISSINQSRTSRSNVANDVFQAFRVSRVPSAECRVTGLTRRLDEHASFS